MALTTIYALVFYQIALMTECLITHFTTIRALTTMNVFVFYQITLWTECLITHFTSIRAITTMYALVFYQSALITECLNTLHKYGGAHHYVCAGVLSDCSYH